MLIIAKGMHMSLRTFWKLVLTLSFGCGGCEDEPSRVEEEVVREQGGSVAKAAAITKNSRTEDGYEVISVTPAMRRRNAEKAEQEARDREHLVLEPTEPDPENGEFTLEEAVVGLGTDGTLVAEISTTLGTMFCDLYAEKTPRTVANFVGLARGLRPWWDARHGQWRRFRYYDRGIFHRVIPEYLIQTGDYLHGGEGPVGYSIADEPHDSLRHDRAGQLCMASADVDKNSAQFFITDGARPDLDTDSRFTIFGQCRPVELVERIARVPQGEENRPISDVEIRNIIVRRVRGGAANATRTLPQHPEGYDPETTPLQASPGPAEQQIGGHPENDSRGGVFDPRQWRGMRPE